IKEMIPIEMAQQKPYPESELKNVIVHTKIIPSKSKMIGTPILRKRKPSSRTTEKKTTHQAYFTQIIHPKPNLIIFGAGLDSHPFAFFSKQSGFSVTIWDWRPSLLDKTVFPHIRLIHTESIEEAISRTGVGGRDYVVIMTHDFQKDKEILSHIIQMDGLHYIGICGPRRRTRRLMKGQKNIKTGKSFRTIPPYIHSPIGLPISAEGPDEIAVSIVAELISVKREKWNEERASIESL